ncbi:DUF4214 domain-containing protein [Pseudoduganella sp. LjRoot289]|uniref:DUF4214 domain-containing protein n=1 Tax=Pseudoduganella sp. LjRoot289 TaxID=3342314 RepID=UPI003ECDD3DD
MDTIAPRLTSFKLPATIDLSLGQADLAFRVDARDETYGSGMRMARVWLQQSPVSPLGPTGAVVVGLPGGADVFGDATPTVASAVLPLSTATPNGVYRVYDVEVIDQAGNARHYYESDLIAMGQNTAVTVSGGVADTSAPVLTGLTLPGTVDLSNGAGAIVFSAQAQDAGGSGVAGVELYFDRNLQLDSTTGATVSVGGLMAGGADTFWDGTRESSAYSGQLSASTGTGAYHLLSAVVTDQSGNSTEYSAAQLAALGLATGFEVTGGTPSAATASVASAYTGGNVVLSVASQAWTDGGNAISFQLHYDPAVAHFVGAELVGGSMEGLVVSSDENGGMGVLTISGSAANGAAAGAFLALTLAPQATSGNMPYAVGAFLVNGQQQDLGDAAQTAFYFGDEGVGLQFGEQRLMLGGHNIAFDTDGNAGQAYRLYQAAFDRAPDLPGLGFWIHAMDGGVALRDVAASFLGSPEYAGLYGSNPSATEFVAELYQNVLHREPEQAGFDFWVHALGAGVARSQLLVDFSESPENVAQVIGAIQNGIAYVPY